MRVVARDAAQAALALSKTATCRHLLDMPDGLEPASITFFHQENSQETMNRQAWAVVQRLSPRTSEADRSLKMTLFTDRIPQRRGQSGRVDDGQVEFARLDGTLQMKLTRTVATLTADGVSLENWRLVTIQRSGYRMELVGMAIQAVGLDRPLEVRLRGKLCVAGGDTPVLLLCVPRDRRLEQKTIAFNQISNPTRTGAESEPDFRLDLGKHRPRSVAPGRPVEDPSVVILDGVTHPLGFDRQSGSGAGRWSVLGAGHRLHRSAHRVRAVSLGDFPVTRDARNVSDIGNPRMSILVRRARVNVAQAMRVRGRVLPAPILFQIAGQPSQAVAAKVKAAAMQTAWRERAWRGGSEGFASLTASSRGFLSRLLGLCTDDADSSLPCARQTMKVLGRGDQAQVGIQ